MGAEGVGSSTHLGFVQEWDGDFFFAQMRSRCDVLRDAWLPGESSMPVFQVGLGPGAAIRYGGGRLRRSERPVEKSGWKERGAPGFRVLTCCANHPGSGWSINFQWSWCGMGFWPLTLLQIGTGAFVRGGGEARETVCLRGLSQFHLFGNRRLLETV